MPAPKKSQANAPTASSSTEAQSIPQIQADEIEALSSILGPDFVAGDPARSSPWGAAAANAQQPFFVVTLRPDNDTYRDEVSVKVEFRLPRRYPSIPLIVSAPTNPKASSVSNVSANHLTALGQALRSKAAELAQAGEEAMWEVYSHGAEVLSQHNIIKEQREEAVIKEQARRQAELVPSLDEQKRQREDEGEKAKAREHRIQTEAARKTTEEKASTLAKVISEREEAMRAERARRKVVFETTSDPITEPQKGNGVVSPQAHLARTSSAETISLPLDTLEVDPKRSPLPSPAAIPTQPPVLLAFDPPLQLSNHETAVSRVQVSPALESLRSTGGLASIHMATPYGDGIHFGSPRRLSRIHITSPYFSTSRGRRKLAGVEREIEALSKIKNPHIRTIEGYQLTRNEAAPHAFGSTQIYLSDKDQLDGFVLSIVESPSGPSEVKLEALLGWQPLTLHQSLRAAQQLLSAAASLHETGLLLKEVTLDRIALRQDHSLLIDGIWTGCVAELDRGNPLQEDRDSTLQDWVESWTAPELLSEARYTRKTDAFVIGRIWLKCLTGTARQFADPWEAFNHLETAAIAAGASQAPLKLLSRLLERSPRRRMTPVDALDHLSSILEDGGHAAIGTLTIPQASNDQLIANTPVKSAAPALVRDGPSSHLGRSFFSSQPQQAPSTSRFLTDFVPLSVLGKGAFGVVTKVKNRLDGGVYAVKKIRLGGGGEDGDQKTLREIGALARVNHPHVYRYYAAWIEEAANDAIDESASGMTNSVAATSDTHSNSTPTTRTQAHSFSLSFGPPKDSDFDDADQADEGDFLSQVGFRADTSDNDDSSSCSSDEDTDSSSSSSESKSESSDRVSRLGRLKRNQGSLAAQPHSSRQHSVARASQAAVARKPRWLYIQMELVDDITLREVIERGPLAIDDCWRYLRQILNALVHIHNLGIVHRDLKPSNILMSGADVKIGDFGLATTLETVPTAAPDGHSHGNLTSSGFLPTIGGGGVDSSSGAQLHALVDGGDDMTGEVGTALYAAPEIVRQQRGVRYGYKVDMYSLGIICFEMVASGRSYTTGMERVHRLRNLRQPSMEFPPNWPTGLVKEKEVVKWLVTHKPEQRPSPLQLLQSDLLPPRLEDESVQETLRLVTDPSSVYHLQLMDTLFAPKSNSEEEIRDATFDAGSHREDGNSLIHPREAVVADFLRMVFLRHGAVEVVPPLLMPPRSELYSNKDGGNPVTLLDSTGQKVHLPRDHLIPFARTIARSDNHRLKRYCIGPVYRESLLPGGQPMSILAANMDIIVGAGGNMPCAAEGECLACLEEILAEVPGYKNDWVILINHGAILELLMERVPVRQQASVLALLSTLGAKQGPSGSSANARAKLTQQLNLPKSVVDELEACASMSDDIESAHAKLDRIIPVDHRPMLAKAIAAIVEVRECARKFGVPAERRFLLSPLLSNYSQCYKGGVFFQVARATGGKKRRGRWDVVASGGRYSSLIARFATPISGPPPSGVGIQIAVSKLVHALAKDQEISELRRPPDLWTPRRADVYVHSGQGMLDTRIDICRELWANGIRADLSYDDDAGQESMLMVAARCKDEGFSYLIYAQRSIKVRSLWSKTHDLEFQSTFDLVPWISEQLSRMLGGSGGVTTGPLGLTDAPASGLGSETQALSYGNATPGTAGGPGGIAGSGNTAANAVTGSGSGFGASAEVLGGGSTVMETQVVLPVQSSSRQKDKSDRGNTADRRVKLQSQHPIINSATREAHRMAVAISSGDIPLIAVDLRGDHFDNLCSAAMAKETARKDVAWRTFFDTLGSSDEREYAKNIRGHIEKSQGGNNNNSGQVMLFSIREKRCAVVGTTSLK